MTVSWEDVSIRMAGTVHPMRHETSLARVTSTTNSPSRMIFPFITWNQATVRGMAFRREERMVAVEDVGAAKTEIDVVSSKENCNLLA